MSGWSGWEKAGATPYVDWWHKMGGVEEWPAPDARNELVFIPSPPLDLLESDQGAAEGDWSSRGVFQDAFPVPRYAANKDFQRGTSWLPHPFAASNQGGMPPPEKLPKVPPDTVIVGVIDVGVPLGHDRLRDANGTRILAAWQMLAEHIGDYARPYLPCGRELYKDDIDALIGKHSVGGWLDEDAFNEATGTLDKRNLAGPRDLAARFSHGAHVLDAAAGADPDAKDKEEVAIRKNAKVIAVNIPSALTFGPAGTFLDQIVAIAILRILDLADAIWGNPSGGTNTGDGRRGFPIVINLSFGKQAGSKTLSDSFPEFLRSVQEARMNKGFKPLDLVMPAGNDNLLRCNAFIEPLKGKAGTIRWQTLPEDYSSNFVEIWTQPWRPEATGWPIEISVAPPGGDPQDYALEPPMPGGSCKLGDHAAVYFEERNVFLEGRGYGGQDDAQLPHISRYRYVICLAPTAHPTRDDRQAPAGCWTIRIKNGNYAQFRCALSVQTDQAVLPSGAVNKRSYFDERRYRVFDEEGRPVGSHAYPSEGARLENTDLVPPPCCAALGPVRRHGTMNASAAHGWTSAIGGYRASDGKPAAYSATGIGRRSGEDAGIAPPDPNFELKDKNGKPIDDGGKRAPTAAFPTDDGPAHPGILSAGSGNGSVVAAQGTSFASAQATRRVALERIKGKAETGKALLYAAGDGAEKKNSFGSVSDIDTTGGGRAPSPLLRRVTRINGP